ncbi:unnamed protein product [Ixodes hexagonus]
MELLGCGYGGTCLLVASILVAIGEWGFVADAAGRNRTTEDLPIVFPDDNTAAETAPPPRRARVNDASGFGPPARNEIPESLLFSMRNVRNLTDFVSQFLEGYQDVSTDGFGESPSILGKKGPAGAAAVPNPEPGTCIPSKQLVEFPKPTDPTVILWPPCTRVPRCGGCCPSSILKCAPTKTTNVTFKVIKAQYPEQGASKFNFMGHEIVTLERHDKCGCECKEKPSDCNAMQDYQECRCICRNANQMQLCTDPGVFWDHRECRCKCKDYAECSTGFYYNVRSCRCEQLSRSRIDSRILPLPKLYAPYTDNRENQQSRSYRNLDILAPADDYSRPYANTHFTAAKRDTSASVLRARTETSLPSTTTSRTSLSTSRASSRNLTSTSSVPSTPRSALASRSPS